MNDNIIEEPELKLHPEDKKPIQNTIKPFQLVNGRKWKGLNSTNNVRNFPPELQITIMVKLIEANSILPKASKLASYFVDPKSEQLYVFWVDRSLLNKYWPKNVS